MKDSMRDDARRMCVLLVSGYDSTNAVLARFGAALRNAGHDAVVVSAKPDDETNNHPYARCGLKVIALADLDDDLFDRVDVVVASPIKPEGYDALYREIRCRGLLVFSFASLLSSVTMRVLPDFVFAAGESTVREFRDSGLDYNFIVAGNPQYDGLGGDCRRQVERRCGAVAKIIVIDQGGYPYGKAGKSQLAHTLIRMASCNPGIQFDVRLRYQSTGKPSRTLHSVSEQLVDYLADAPSNLRCLPGEGELEDIVAGYDAMIALWSTAYRCALACHMPLLLLSGFDSIDMFDVRLQRVDEAYRHLEASGCVRRYDEVKGDITQYLKVADAAFAEDELAAGGAPCAADLVRFVELACETLGKQHLRACGPFEFSIAEYYRRFPELELCDADAPDVRAGRAYDEAYNALMQDAVHLNRSMGNALDLGQLVALRDGGVAGCDPLQLEDRLARLRADFAEKLDEAETRYFESDDGRRAVERDPIAQDRWFEWLYGKGRVEVIEGGDITPLLAPETREYYLARIALDCGQCGLAHDHLVRFFSLANAREAQQFARCRKLGKTLRPFKRADFMAVCAARLATRDGRSLLRFALAGKKGDMLTSVMNFLRR